MEILQFKDKKAQAFFKNLTTQTSKFSKCFDGNEDFEDQADNWKKTLNDHFHKAFKKIRIKNTHKNKQTKLNELIDKRNRLRNIT